MTEPFAALEVMQLAGQYDLHQSHIRNEGLSKATDVKNKIVELKVLLERLRVAAKELEENNSTSLESSRELIEAFQNSWEDYMNAHKELVHDNNPFPSEKFSIESPTNDSLQHAINATRDLLEMAGYDTQTITQEIKAHSDDYSLANFAFGRIAREKTWKTENQRTS